MPPLASGQDRWHDCLLYYGGTAHALHHNPARSPHLRTALRIHHGRGGMRRAEPRGITATALAFLLRLLSHPGSRLSLDAPFLRHPSARRRHARLVAERPLLRGPVLLRLPTGLGTEAKAHDGRRFPAPDRRQHGGAGLVGSGGRRRAVPPSHHHPGVRVRGVIPPGGHCSACCRKALAGDLRRHPGLFRPCHDRGGCERPPVPRSGEGRRSGRPGSRLPGARRQSLDARMAYVCSGESRVRQADDKDRRLWRFPFPADSSLPRWIPDGGARQPRDLRAGPRKCQRHRDPPRSDRGADGRDRQGRHDPVRLLARSCPLLEVRAPPAGSKSWSSSTAILMPWRATAIS